MRLRDLAWEGQYAVAATAVVWIAAKKLTAAESAAAVVICPVASGLRGSASASPYCRLIVPVSGNCDT
jgi:hypothetical protein